MKSNPPVRLEWAAEPPALDALHNVEEVRIEVADAAGQRTGDNSTCERAAGRRQPAGDQPVRSRVQVEVWVGAAPDLVARVCSGIGPCQHDDTALPVDTQNRATHRSIPRYMKMPCRRPSVKAPPAVLVAHRRPPPGQDRVVHAAAQGRPAGAVPLGNVVGADPAGRGETAPGIQVAAPSTARGCTSTCSCRCPGRTRRYRPIWRCRWPDPAGRGEHAPGVDVASPSTAIA